MGKFLSGGRLFGLLALIILLVVVAGMTLRSRISQLTWPERWLHDSESVVSGWIYEPVFQIDTFFRHLRDLQTLYEENAQLQTLVNQDQSLRSEVYQEQQQNQILKQMLDYKGKVPQFQLIAGEVTGRSPISWNDELTISVGTRAGVVHNDPVINQSGQLIGRVVAVAQYSSTVELITSTATSDGVSAAIVTSGAPAYGVIQGSRTHPGMLSMQFISQLARGIKPGDQVTTSGLSDIYPRGLVIGTITQFTSDSTGITRSAIVAPAANMSALEYVFVVSPQPGQVLK
ncbi:rod shape-determining protein MreC [Sulfoacidibacillus thermotolerans]|uniref:Cell shape-determining protein MreC n=1 Tax=Sulfoacidibacillus thermotolerans TaxID=1765684 RepID=A0A2U3DCJ9_SULT2|nr:rod shape-determining protein MreC [Sulfoacidibacillus thermotolerans]PWI59007.1 rod shape-determining protein MreC [Sulfoacidibacillus thermotolerans]